MKHISFFSGIGGFDIAAERVGFENVMHVEIDPFCRSILQKLYPNSISIADIHELKYALPKAQIYTAGFPCQDASKSNKQGKGTKGEKTGLFSTFLRICGDNRPDYIVMENVPNLLNRGFENVLIQLSQIGYNAEWECLQAAKFGYPHQRERLFIVAYPNSKRFESMVFRPEENNTIPAKWQASQTYTSFANRWNEGYGHTENLHRSNGFSEIKQLIHALGNAVIPEVAEYIFRLIIHHKANEIQ